MADAERSAYPWLAGPEEMSLAGTANGTDSSNGSEPLMGEESAAMDGTEAPVVADSPSMHDSGSEPAVPFLQSLVDAMRKIADQTRDDALAKLRAAVAERSAGIRAESEQRAAELHEAADADLARVADWENAEIQRIREEASAKVAARNATLEAQLAANVAAGEGAMTAVEARADAFEAEMTSFFAQLNDIQDPAALAAALKRIPEAPSLTEPVAARAGDTAPAPATAAPAAPEAVTAERAAEPMVAPEPPSGSATAIPETAASAEAHPDQAAAAVAVATAPEPAVEAATTEPPAAEAAAEETGEEATTQVVVTGLTSFGAITSFKQSLERVAGVHRVALGLGTSGEFIFTAVHRAGFDLATAIRSFEETAQFVASDGQLRVTVGSKA